MGNAWAKEEVSALLTEVDLTIAMKEPKSVAFKKIAEQTGKKLNTVAKKYSNLLQKQKKVAIAPSTNSLANKAEKIRQKPNNVTNLGSSQKLIQQLLAMPIEIGPNTSITLTPTELIIKF